MLTRQQTWVRTRCALLTGAVTVGAALLAGPLTRGAAAPASSVSEALTRLCSIALAAALGWAWLATLSVVAEAWRGRPGRRRVAAPLRRAVLLCCGVALAAPTGLAAADEHPSPTPSLAGLPMPERAVGAAHPPADRSVQRPAHRSVPRSVVVRPGDCLWRLAAADLPAEASAARVTTRWQTIHRLNGAVIGPDPDLIHPGQRLVLPPRPVRR
jgi:nucleoid-associated protein YgaU